MPLVGWITLQLKYQKMPILQMEALTTKHYSAFMQSFADKKYIDEHHLRWKTISKCFNKQLFNFSTGIKSVHGIGTPLREREDRVGLSVYTRSSKEQDEIYPPKVSEIADARRSDKVLKKYFHHGGECVSSKYS